LKLIDGSPNVWIGSTTVGTEKEILRAASARAALAREVAAELRELPSWATAKPAAAAHTTNVTNLRIPASLS
jgi:hypothetical protein